VVSTTAANGFDALGLGQHDGCHAGMAAQVDVVVEPRCTGSVDAHDERRGLVECDRQRSAGTRLGLGRDRVFQVDDHHVGTGEARALAKRSGRSAGTKR
jgi:hypothetical protein